MSGKVKGCQLFLSNSNFLGSSLFPSLRTIEACCIDNRMKLDPQNSQLILQIPQTQINVFKNIRGWWPRRSPRRRLRRRRLHPHHLLLPKQPLPKQRQRLQPRLRLQRILQGRNGIKVTQILLCHRSVVRSEF